MRCFPRRDACIVLTGEPGHDAVVRPMPTDSVCVYADHVAIRWLLSRYDEVELDRRRESLGTGLQRRHHGRIHVVVAVRLLIMKDFVHRMASSSVSVSVRASNKRFGQLITFRQDPSTECKSDGLPI